MAVTTGIVNVNNDQTGWTSSDVMDALETVFNNLGMHGGTSLNGSPVCVKWPGQGDNESPNTSANGFYEPDSYGTQFNACGGVPAVAHEAATRNFTATANGTSGYYMQETFQPTNISTSNNTLTVPHNYALTTGKELVFIPSGGDSTNVIGGLTLAATYFVIRVDETTIQLADTLANANASTALPLSAAPTAGWGSTTRFWEPQSGSENAQIDTYCGETLNFTVDSTGMFICSGDSYSSTKTLDAANDSTIPVDDGPFHSSGWITNNGTTSFTFNTKYWLQSEDNTDVESFDKPDNFRQGNVHQGSSRSSWSDMVNTTPPYGGRVIEYCYASDTNATMKGVINIMPDYNYRNTYYNPYWKVTIPGGSGTGTGTAGKDLKLRVYRYDYDTSSSYRGRICAIDVCNVTDGWSDSPTFTIPGEDIGGVATTNDIAFGTNTDETSSGAADGICSLHVTNYGSGTSFYQKNALGRYAVLKLRHDAAKQYGDSYYAFYIANDNPHRMIIKSGAYWETQNCLGTNATPSTTTQTGGTGYIGFYGFMDGLMGMNTQAHNYANTNYPGTYETYHQFCNESIPTDYRLHIKYFRAQSPQDDKFAVISFCQTIDGEMREFWTFTLPTPTWGVTSPGVDLDHLYHGHVVTIEESGTSSNKRGIDIQMEMCAYNGSWNSEQQPADESNPDSYTLIGQSSYGYFRDKGNAGGGAYKYDRYYSNIATHNNEDVDIVTYYRNADYDGTHGSMDYYRPIKGIPLLNSFAPHPYYMPDDFVLIQVGTAPALSEFRSGDTITVSGSEVYTVIVASYEQSTTGLDDVSNGSCIGMLFCARTTG